MRRTTIKLPDELDARLRHEAARRGVTISELTREAIAEHLNGRRTTGRGARLAATAAGHGGGADVAGRIEELLAEEPGRGR